MSRPAFQFYPADWRKNAKLRRCSPAARGVWVDILCLLHDADEYGVLRWPLKDIVQAAGASRAHVRELVEKGVLKGADADAVAYVYRPRHAGKEGAPVTLVISDGGPVWYCSRFVRDEYVRQRRGEATRFDTDNQPPKGQPKGGIGDRQGDGPSFSSSSSATHSVPDGTGSAGAAPVVDNSGLDPTAEQESKRALWRDAKDWLVSNGCAAGDAKAFVNTLAKEYPKLIEQALREAIKVRREPGDAKPYLIGIVERLAAESRKLTPTDRAERAVEATQERLRQQAERTPDPAPEAVKERLAAARAALAASAGLAPKPAEAPAEPEGSPA